MVSTPAVVMTRIRRSHGWARGGLAAVGYAVIVGGEKRREPRRRRRPGERPMGRPVNEGIGRKVTRHFPPPFAGEGSGPPAHASRASVRCERLRRQGGGVWTL